MPQSQLISPASCVVWWSGPSATPLLVSTPRCEYEIGCNHIEQWRSVDSVVAYDRQIVQNLIKQDTFNVDTQYWTQRVWTRPGWDSFTIDKHYQQVHDSGTLAVEVALHLGHRMIHIIGADWHVTNDSIQQEHYAFRGHKPNKMPERKKNWLSRVSSRCEIVWVHPVRAAWMRHYL